MTDEIPSAFTPDRDLAYLDEQGQRIELSGDAIYLTPQALAVDEAIELARQGVGRCLYP